MSTKRLYFDDPQLLLFDATVRELATHASRPALILDRTAFYPTGGGQPHDTGRLAGAGVVDVVEAEDGAVLHVLEAAPGRIGPGDRVRGQVDAGRRRDHMQQHSGQHLLSAAFVQAAGAQTRSFHLGTSICDIDLDRTPDRLGDVAAVEELANRVIAEDRPVTARVVDERGARGLALRKEAPVEGPVRILTIEEFDRTPCGGTHVGRTGEIGMLAILGTERHRGGTRVRFVAGDRVRAALHRAADEAAAVGALISAPEGERAQAVRRLLDERREAGSRLRELAVRAGRLEAATLAAATPAGRVVGRQIEDRTRGEVEAVARALADAGRVALLGWREGEAGGVVLAGPGTPDVGALLRQVAPRFSARGGGNARFAQAGGVAPAKLGALLAALAAKVED